MPTSLNYTDRDVEIDEGIQAVTRKAGAVFPGRVGTEYAQLGCIQTSLKSFNMFLRDLQSAITRYFGDT